MAGTAFATAGSLATSDGASVTPVFMVESATEKLGDCSCVTVRTTAPTPTTALAAITLNNLRLLVLTAKNPFDPVAVTPLKESTSDA